MKGIFRAIIGIGATIAIIFLVERTMASFGFFADATPVEEETLKADSVEIAKIAQEAEQEKIRKRINEVIKDEEWLVISADKQVQAQKVYKKKTFMRDDYMNNFAAPDSAIAEHDQRIEVTFDLDEKSVEAILFLALEGYNTVDDKAKERFFKPRVGLNRLRLKTNFPAGKYQFHVGYFLKEEAKRTTTRFYNQAFDVTIE